MDVGFYTLITFFFLIFLLLLQYVISHKYYGMHLLINGFLIVFIVEYYNAQFITIFGTDLSAAIMSLFIIVYSIYMSALKILMALGKII